MLGFGRNCVLGKRTLPCGEMSARVCDGCRRGRFSVELVPICERVVTEVSRWPFLFFVDAVLLCVAFQSVQIAVEWRRQGLSKVSCSWSNVLLSPPSPITSPRTVYACPGQGPLGSLHWDARNRCPHPGLRMISATASATKLPFEPTTPSHPPLWNRVRGLLSFRVGFEPKRHRHHHVN